MKKETLRYLHSFNDNEFHYFNDFFERNQNINYAVFLNDLVFFVRQDLINVFGIDGADEIEKLFIYLTRKGVTETELIELKAKLTSKGRAIAMELGFENKEEKNIKATTKRPGKLTSLLDTVVSFMVYLITIPRRLREKEKYRVERKQS